MSSPTSKSWVEISLPENERTIILYIRTYLENKECCILNYYSLLIWVVHRKNDIIFSWKGVFVVYRIYCHNFVEDWKVEHTNCQKKEAQNVNKLMEQCVCGAYTDIELGDMKSLWERKSIHVIILTRLCLLLSLVRAWCGKFLHYECIMWFWRTFCFQNYAILFTYIY